MCWDHLDKLLVVFGVDETKEEINGAPSKPIATMWDMPQRASLSFDISSGMLSSHCSLSKMTPPGGKATRNGHISDFLSPGCSGSHFTLPHKKKGNKAAKSKKESEWQTKQ